jgi:glucose/arabinose dehydrogenase
VVENEWSRRRVIAAAAGAAAVVGAGVARAATPPTPATLETAFGAMAVETVAHGLALPYRVVPLPEGDFLVSEKHAGRLRRVRPDGRISPPLAGLPPVYGEGNGGLLGLALDRDFARSRIVFLAYAEPGTGDEAGLAVARARLRADRLAGFEVIFRQRPKVADIRNFGGRLAVASDGTVFIGTGDRFAHDLVQRPDNTIGVVARVAADGGIPPDNPFVGRDDVDPAIWSLGHRNIGGMAFHPATGRLWVHEFGPFGGDELNIAEPGRNYGWPLVSWGRHYTGEAIPPPPTRPDLAPAIFHWNPVISPSGMAFYDGAAIPPWRGSLLIGGLSGRLLVRLSLRGERVVAEERLPLGVRIRDVAVDAAGAVLLLTDEGDGRLLRITRAAA